MSTIACRAFPIVLLAALLLAPTAWAAGPFSHFGVILNPGDATIWAHPDVGPTETQYMKLILDTGDVLRPPTPGVSGTHLGFGLRGQLVQPGQAPRGRGVILGYFPNAANVGNCTAGPHIAIEDFTLNYQLRDDPNAGGIVPGSCQPFAFQDHTGYQLEVWATLDDVRYVVSERFWDWELRRWTWEPVLFGGCWSTAGRACPQQPSDADFGNFFVGGTSTDESKSWSAQQILVTHY